MNKHSATLPPLPSPLPSPSPSLDSLILPCLSLHTPSHLIHSQGFTQQLSLKVKWIFMTFPHISSSFQLLVYLTDQNLKEIVSTSITTIITIIAMSTITATTTSLALVLSLLPSLPGTIYLGVYYVSGIGLSPYQQQPVYCNLYNYMSRYYYPYFILKGLKKTSISITEICNIHSDKTKVCFYSCECNLFFISLQIFGEHWSAKQ